VLPQPPKARDIQNPAALTRYLQQLHAALQPLNGFRFPDGRAALRVTIRTSREAATSIDQRFENNYLQPWRDHRDKGLWIMTVVFRDPALLMNQKPVDLYWRDFIHGGLGVSRVLKRVDTFLSQHGIARPG
jgi:hypothetical protein